MDAIRLSGYTSDEKISITKKHLLPDGLKKAVLTTKKLKIYTEAKQIEEFATAEEV